LSRELRGIVDEHRAIYDLGVHGPDVLFYYRPLRPNHVKNLGRACHRTCGDEFFRHCCEVTARTVDASARGREPRKADCARGHEAHIAYLLGVLCHYMLDRECHPYVYARTGAGASHSAIEASFDRHLMVLDHLDPLKHSPTHHLKPSPHAARVMQDFYPLLTNGEIFGAQVSMKLMLRVLAARPPARPLFMTVAGLNGFRDLFIPPRPRRDLVDSDLRLKELYDDAVARAPGMIDQLMAHLNQGAPFGPEFHHTFGKD
jgi:hypothetical protein